MIRIISFIKLQYGTTNAIVEELKKIPEIVKITTVTGEYDILLELEGNDPEILGEAFMKKIDHIPGLKEIHSNYIMKVWQK